MDYISLWNILLSKVRLSDGFCDVEIGKNQLWNHTLSEDKYLIEKIRSILNSNMAALSFQEAINLYRMTIRTEKLSGSIAEVGTYHGGSALIMLTANKNKRKMHLFDTFTGIPEVTPGVDTVTVGALCGCSLASVKMILHEYNHLIEYHVGIFPETTSDIPTETKFSLVNLDMDVYQGTKSALEYFYPRMVCGGVIVCHDYFSQSCPGVTKAVDEFFDDKPETIVDLWHSQILVVKCSSPPGIAGALEQKPTVSEIDHYKQKDTE